ncbi:MAG: hypothetical protein AMJ61_03030 [Desulfobacterales bacterium SG8_35_2]|nr:MAG: hypothetical protein AMJ61_03030 [Desulfobacterales bacterium SG8_35_2]
MLRKSVLSGLLFLIICLPSTLVAQERMHGKWWHDKSIAQELDLTDTEKKEIDAKYAVNRRKMIDLKYEICKICS